MSIPSVVHPTQFAISGMFFRVTAYVPLSEAQAAKLAMQFYRSRKFKKSDKGKQFTVVTVVDENLRSLL